MVREIVLSSKAEADFTHIINYLLENWSENEASNFESLLDKRFCTIQEFPFAFPIVYLNVRKCLVTKQVSIFYDVKENEIRILRVFDTRQSPDKLKID